MSAWTGPPRHGPDLRPATEPGPAPVFRPCLIGCHCFHHPALSRWERDRLERLRRDLQGMAGATARTPCRPSTQQPGLIPEARTRILCTATFFPVSRRIPVRTAGTARRAGVTHACTHRSVPSDPQPPRTWRTARAIGSDPQVRGIGSSCWTASRGCPLIPSACASSTANRP